MEASFGHIVWFNVIPKAINYQNDDFQVIYFSTISLDFMDDFFPMKSWQKTQLFISPLSVPLKY